MEALDRSPEYNVNQQYLSSIHHSHFFSILATIDAEGSPQWRKNKHIQINILLGFDW